MRLCRLADLEDPGSKGFNLGEPGRPRALFLVRQGEQVYAYENHCPHAGSPLDWLPDRFLSADQRHIQCATHDALFRIEDGLCVAGPCPGQRLRSLPLEIRDGTVWLVDSTWP